MRFIGRFYRILERKEYLEKWTTPNDQTPWRGAPEALSPMQLHWLHRLKADPDGRAACLEMKSGNHNQKLTYSFQKIQNV